MSEISPINPTPPPGDSIDRSASPGQPAQPTPPAAGPDRGDDRVEVSLQARLMSKAAGLPPVRYDLIDRVRAEIVAGDYETPDKIKAVINELVRQIT